MNGPELMNNLWMISGFAFLVWIAHSLQLRTRRFAPISFQRQPFDRLRHFRVIPDRTGSY
jgi:hypothetical protein